MRRIFNKIISIGVSPGEADSVSAKFIKRSNFANLTIEIMMLPYAMLYYLMGAYLQGYLMIVLFFLFGSTFLLNHKGWMRTARVWQIFLVCVGIFYFGSTLGKNSSIHYLFFVATALPFYLFRIKDVIAISSCLVLFFVLFFIMEFELIPVRVVLDRSAQDILRTSMLALVMIWLIVSFLYYHITNEQTEEKISLKNIQLESQNRELEQFLYIASHDLKEPVRTVGSFSSLLKEEIDPPPDSNKGKYLNYILDATARMGQLIEGLLQYSRLGQAGELKKINCTKLVDTVVEDLTFLKEETRAEIKYSKLPVIRGHEIEMRMLFQNLLGNAMKFRKPDEPPRIEIKATRQNDLWHFSIKDNGLGIEKNFYKKIFVIFYRVHDRKVYDGVGIGLAVCKKIVEQHNGTIWVTSKHGQGSTFHFTIPV